MIPQKSINKEEISGIALSFDDFIRELRLTARERESLEDIFGRMESMARSLNK